MSHLNAIAYVLCAFPGKHVDAIAYVLCTSVCMCFYIVHLCFMCLYFVCLCFVCLSKKTMSTIAYIMWASLGRQHQCHHHQHSFVNSLCMSMHCILSTPICECLRCHCQNLLMLFVDIPSLMVPIPNVPSLQVNGLLNKLLSWVVFSNKLRVCMHYVPMMPSLDTLCWGHHCWHK